MNLIPATVIEMPGGRGLRLGAREIAMPAALWPSVKAGRQVTFGFRPEHATRGPAAGSSLVIDVDVRRLERLGAETILIAALAGVEKPVFARFAGDAEFTLGERCSLGLDLGQAHVFGEDGLAIRS